MRKPLKPAPICCNACRARRRGASACRWCPAFVPDERLVRAGAVDIAARDAAQHIIALGDEVAAVIVERRAGRAVVDQIEPARRVVIEILAGRRDQLVALAVGERARPDPGDIAAAIIGEARRSPARSAGRGRCWFGQILVGVAGERISVVAGGPADDPPGRIVAERDALVIGGAANVLRQAYSFATPRHSHSRSLRYCPASGSYAGQDRHGRSWRARRCRSLRHSRGSR